MTIEIIAEISGCHGGSLENAKKLIVEAYEAGATGVKFQCFEAERLAIKRYEHPRLHKIPDLEDLYREIHTPSEWFPELISCAMEAGLTWHASVFDPDDVAFLETLDCPRYKISSFETFDDELVEAAMKTDKPLIISVNQNEESFPPKYHTLTILHATDYGVPASKAELSRLRYWAQYGGHALWAWGLSDHTTDHYAAEIAVTYGARMIEWHIKLPNVTTPDDDFSWAASSFNLKVGRIRKIEEILGG
jgi:pseudaminic acid synthase